MNLLRSMQLGSLLVPLVFVGSMALAQEQSQQEPATDHGAHHGAADSQAGQKASDGKMMGQGGMKGQGQGMMRQGGMMGQGSKADGKGMMGKGMMDCPMMGKGMMHARPMMEARLAYIKADLEITETQTKAWDGYTAAVRARHTAMEGMHADMMKAKETGSVVERMDAGIKAMEAKLEGLKTLKPSTEALYGVLTDEQKKKADKLLGGGCGMM
jgi:LTXXQ motif family protein